MVVQRRCAGRPNDSPGSPIVRCFLFLGRFTPYKSPRGRTPGNLFFSFFARGRFIHIIFYQSPRRRFPRRLIPLVQASGGCIFDALVFLGRFAPHETPRRWCLGVGIVLACGRRRPAPIDKAVLGPAGGIGGAFAALSERPCLSIVPSSHLRFPVLFQVFCLFIAWKILGGHPFLDISAGGQSSSIFHVSLHVISNIPS